MPDQQPCERHDERRNADLRDDRSLRSTDYRYDGQPDQDRDPSRVIAPVRELHRAAVTAAMPLRYAIERSISPRSSTKTTPYAIIVTPAICRMTFTKFPAVKKFVAVS